MPSRVVEALIASTDWSLFDFANGNASQFGDQFALMEARDHLQG